MHFNKNGIIECMECSGNKIIHKPINILEVCPTCRGTGGIDWVEYAMSRKPEYSRQLLYNVVHKNIQFLTHLIYEEGKKIDKQIEVKIKYHSMEEFHRMMPSMVLRRP